MIPLHALATGRYRTPAVSEQVTRIVALRGRCLRALVTDGSSSPYPLLHMEALVCALRVFRRAGRCSDADIIAGAIHRSTQHIIRTWLSQWLHGASLVCIEMCESDVQETMWKSICCDAKYNEFWELAFWLCLRRRAMNCATSIRRSAYLEVSEYNATQSGELSLFDCPRLHSVHCADDPDISVDRMWLQQAIAQLRPDEQDLIRLVYFDGYSSYDLKSRYNAHDRTIRHKIQRALVSLRAICAM